MLCAERPIVANEELFIDYGDGFWDDQSRAQESPYAPKVKRWTDLVTGREVEAPAFTYMKGPEGDDDDVETDVDEAG